jgi:nudix motif 8
MRWQRAVGSQRTLAAKGSVRLVGSAAAATTTTSLQLDAARAAMADLQKRRTAIKKVKGARAGPAGRSAVLVGLCTDVDSSEPCVLLTLRAKNMRTHRSEVAFPGGREDEADEGSPVATALRELEEECGIGRTSVEILGLSHDLPLPGKLRVTPVVGWLGPVDVAQLSLSPAEVQQAFLAPFSTLRDPALKSWHQVNGSKVKMPMFGGCEHKVWGLTAYILHQLLDEIDHAL